VLFNILKWEDIRENLERGTVLFIFGGGLSPGLDVSRSGAGVWWKIPGLVQSID